MSHRLALAALLLAASATPLAAQGAAGSSGAPATDTVFVPVSDSAALATVHRYMDWFWAAEGDSLWAHLDEQSRTSLRDPVNLADQIFGFMQQFGMEIELVSESLERRGDRFRYVRTVRLDGADEPWVLTWLFESDGLIVDVDLNPAG